MKIRTIRRPLSRQWLAEDAAVVTPKHSGLAGMLARLERMANRELRRHKLPTDFPTRVEAPGKGPKAGTRWRLPHAMLSGTIYEIPAELAGNLSDAASAAVELKFHIAAYRELVAHESLTLSRSQIGAALELGADVQRACFRLVEARAARDLEAGRGQRKRARAAAKRSAAKRQAAARTKEPRGFDAAILKAAARLDPENERPRGLAGRVVAFAGFATHDSNVRRANRILRPAESDI